MNVTSDQHEPGREQTNSDEIVVSWETKLPLLGSSGASPVTRHKSAAEQAMANMFRLAEEAGNFEDCIKNFEKAANICREYGLQISPPPPVPHGGSPNRHKARMDAWRIVVTIILVLGVLAIVGWSLSVKNASAAAQYVAPLTGLAGIGLGWLFTNQQSPSSPQKKQDT
jgi:hypothetical protein